MVQKAALQAEMNQRVKGMPYEEEAQAGGDNVFAKLWMVYANADRRWAGVDLVSWGGFLLSVLLRLLQGGVGVQGER